MVRSKMARLKFLNTRFLLIAILLIASFLRLWKLSEVPVSLFGDELDLGYHAYSILKTGKDYSGNFLPLHFQSLAEWRTPLYLYSAVPTVAAFGISPLGARLPAAIFGILGVWLVYLLTKEITGKKGLALLAALFLSISPWHIQYSRAGFEVTQMLALYLAGIYFFLKGLENGKYWILSAIFLALTPWSYSTAKFFLPITLLALLVIWRREVFIKPKKELLYAALAFFMIVAPITHSTIFGGGTARFNYVSVFTDPTMIPEIGTDRLHDAKMRDPYLQFGAQPTLLERSLHNKFTWLARYVGNNYLQPFSTQFLFVNGDPNPRHSPQGIGQFFKIDALFLVLGLVFFSTSKLDGKLKSLILFWLLASPIPAALTRDGGMHATRLFFLLVPLTILISYGVYYSYTKLKGAKRGIFGLVYSGALLLSFAFYQHNFWIHYPWNSERWWHAGYEDSIKTAVKEAPNYDKVIISMAGEPAYIFLLGWAQFDPKIFHENYQERGEGKWLPVENLKGFGDISRLDKYYFGSAGVDLYTLSQVLPDNSLYLATAKEVNVNLILEPERLPSNLKMVKAIPFPSGEPAYYLLTKATQNNEDNN